MVKSEGTVASAARTLLQYPFKELSGPAARNGVSLQRPSAALPGFPWSVSLCLQPVTEHGKDTHAWSFLPLEDSSKESSFIHPGLVKTLSNLHCKLRLTCSILLCPHDHLPPFLFSGVRPASQNEGFSCQ